MANILEVQIVGDISALEKSLKDAEKLQQGYTDSINETNDAIDSLNKQKIADKKIGLDVSGIDKKISSLQDELVDLRGNLTKAGFASEKAADELAKVSNPLDKAAAGAEKAGDAVSDIVSPLLDASGASEEMAEGANVAAAALSGGLAGAITAIVGYLVKLYVESEKAALAIHEVSNEAIASSSAEIATMNALVAVAKNEVNSREERLAAVQKLQDEYPAYFGNLSKEQILNGDVAVAVKAVTFALIQKSKAQILASKIAENDLKILQLQQQGQQQFANYTGGKGVFALLKGAAAQMFLKKSADDTAESIDELTQQQKEYTKQLEESVKVANTFEIKNENAGKKQKEVKVKDPIIPFKSTLKPELDVKETTEALLEVRNEYGKLQEQLIKFDEPVPVKLKIVPNVDASLVKNLPILDELIERYKQITGQPLVLPKVITTDYVKSLKEALQTAELFSNASASAIGTLAGELSSSLETGNKVLDAFVGSVVQGLAQIAAAQLAGLIAKQAVATTSLATDAAVSTGNAITAATETASSTGPAAAFVLPALVGAAIGFIAAAFSGIKFAHGGIVPGGSFTGDKIPAMLNSGETVMNQQQQANTLMAIANGNSNSLQGNRKSSTFVLETKIRGADLQLALKREEKSR